MPTRDPGQTAAMVGRPYDEARDLAAVTRMWREVGWIDDSDGQAESLRRFLARDTALLADVHGEAECMVHRTPGSMRYVDTDLPLCAISGVTTASSRGIRSRSRSLPSATGPPIIRWYIHRM